jgi:hypothetical protein
MGHSIAEHKSTSTVTGLRWIAGYAGDKLSTSIYSRKKLFRTAETCERVSKCCGYKCCHRQLAVMVNSSQLEPRHDDMGNQIISKARCTAQYVPSPSCGVVGWTAGWMREIMERRIGW